MRTLSLVATALIATAAAPSLAKGHAWQVGNDAMHIYYSDIDQTSAAGRGLLLARVQQAADRLCRDRADRRDCATEAVCNAARLPGGSSLQLALNEQGAIRLASR